MTQQDINELVKTIAESNNVCEAMLMIVNSEKEYKQSDFYKQTKISLIDLIKTYKTIHPINWQEVKEELQNIVDNLSFDHLQNMLDSFVSDSQLLTTDFKEQVENFKNSIK